MNGSLSPPSSCFGFSLPRLKPEPIVVLISMSVRPIAFAAVCRSVIVLSMSPAPMCAWRPSVNAALFSASLRPPFAAIPISATMLSLTLLKYCWLICVCSLQKCAAPDVRTRLLLEAEVVVSFSLQSLRRCLRWGRSRGCRLRVSLWRLYPLNDREAKVI